MASPAIGAEPTCTPRKHASPPRDHVAVAIKPTDFEFLSAVAAGRNQTLAKYVSELIECHVASERCATLPARPEASWSRPGGTHLDWEQAE